MRQVLALIQKDILLELRNRYALGGILLYVVSTVFVCYAGIQLKIGKIDPIIWNALLWIILLFTAINALAKSFSQENTARFYYYYTLAKPSSIIVAKILFNFLLMLVLLLLGMVVYSLFLGNPVQDLVQFMVAAVLGASLFSTTLTLISGIASKASNSASLMALLSFPVILPGLLLLLRISKNAMDGLEWSSSQKDLITLLAINTIVATLSVVLFPYLWRS